MPLYNLTSIEGSTSLWDIVKNINNSILGGLGGSLVLIAFFIIVFYSVSIRSTPKDAFIVSSFTSTIIALLMRIIGFVPDYIVISAFTLTIIAGLIAWFGRNQ